jgi:hypothetical protein
MGTPKGASGKKAAYMCLNEAGLERIDSKFVGRYLAALQTDPRISSITISMQDGSMHRFYMRPK